MKQKGVVNTSVSRTATKLIAVKPSTTDRDDWKATADPHLSIQVDAGWYAVEANLHWDFGADNALVTWDGGTAVIDGTSIGEESLVLSTDDATPALAFTFRTTFESNSTNFDVTSFGSGYWSMRGAVKINQRGTFALKWGGVNGGVTHSLLAGSSLHLTPIVT